MADPKLVTAEEARALLKSATPGSMRAADDGSDCGSGCCRTWVVRDNVGIRLALLDTDGEADAKLFAAAPSLARTLIALEAIRPGHESCARLATWLSDNRSTLNYDGCGMAGDEAIVLIQRLVGERNEARTRIREWCDAAEALRLACLSVVPA